MLYRINVENERDKLLADEIINMFLNGNSYDEIAKVTNQNVEFVEWILKYRKMIVKTFGDNIWNSISIKKREMQQIERDRRKELEYEQTMDNVIYYMTNSLYNYDEMSEKTFINKKILQDMISNFDYIESKYGKNMVERLKKAIEMRKRIHTVRREDAIIVKDPKYRSIIYPDIITVSSYQYSLIQKVAMFFECNGDTQRMAMNSEYCLNAIVTSLNESCLKDILLESVYQKLQTLLEVDSILTHNRVAECKMLVKNVVSIAYTVHGDAESLTEILGYPIGVIERILSHPSVPVLCQELGINTLSIQLNESEKGNQLNKSEKGNQLNK